MAKYKVTNSKKYDDMDGVWRTIKGRHIFIRKGQSLKEAMKDSGKFDKKKEIKQEKQIKKQNANISDEEMQKRVVDNMIVSHYGNDVAYRDKKNNLWTTSRDSYNRYARGESDKLGGILANNDEDALKTMIFGVAESKYPYKGYVADEKSGNGKKRDEFINSEFERLKGSIYDSSATRREKVKTNENFAKYYNADGTSKELFGDKSRTPGYENEDRSFAGWELYSDDPNRYKKTPSESQFKEDNKLKVKEAKNAGDVFDASNQFNKTDIIKFKMGQGMSPQLIKAYAREQAIGINERNVNKALDELNNEGSDFTFGSAKIENGKIKTNVGVFMPDERGYVDRDLEIPINKEDSNIHSISAKLRDWRSRHSSPDSFYDEDFYTSKGNDKGIKTGDSINYRGKNEDKLYENVKVDEKGDVYYGGYKLDKDKIIGKYEESKTDRPVAKKLASQQQGKSTRKEVSNKIQKHILDYYSKDFGWDTKTREEGFETQLKAMGMDNGWKAGEEIAKGGSYLIYTDDMRKFLDELNINPKNKKFTDEQVFKTYTSLIGRESKNLYNSIQKEKTMTESQLVKSLMNRGYSKKTAEKMAKQLTKKRK